MLMKKIFTLFTFLTFAFAAFAADTYVFTDKDGNTIANGTTITCNDAEVDDFGGVLVKSGLFIKNVAAPSNYQVSVEANITRIDNGAVQLCFPVNCFSYDTVGKHGGDGKKALAQGQSQSIQTEWLPTAYGESIVEYTAKIFQGVFQKETYTVTVHYIYADPAGVASVDAANVQPVQRYDIMGRQTTVGQRGLHIVRMSDGSVRKVISK